MSRKTFRRHLSMPGLLGLVRQCFETIPDSVKGRKFTLADCLMSGLAVFILKFPSLLKFDEAMRQSEDKENLHNLRFLFGVENAPSDSWLRERLDRVNTRALRFCFRMIFAKLQRGKALKYFTVMDDYYLLAIDGTQIYSSKKVHCDRCCTRHHKGGDVTYNHQMLGASLVHPDHKIVIPLAPEMINKQDGESKNDCERNATQRLLDDLRREHPHLKLIVLQDGLASNGPHIKNLRSKNLRFILVAKEKDHRFLFDWVNNSDDVKTIERKVKTNKGTVLHRFRFVNDVPLNDTHFDESVNFLEYWETRPNRNTTHWTWVTDLELNERTVMQIMRSARSRWRIENENFQTLKNKTNGYHLDHNFGHGKYELCSVVTMLCYLALLIDQVLQLCCPRFQKALKRNKRKSDLWREMRERFKNCKFNDWGSFWTKLSQSSKKKKSKIPNNWRIIWNNLSQPPPKNKVSSTEICT